MKISMPFNRAVKDVAVNLLKLLVNIISLLVLLTPMISGCRIIEHYMYKAMISAQDALTVQ